MKPFPWPGNKPHSTKAYPRPPSNIVFLRNLPKGGFSSEERPLAVVEVPAEALRLLFEIEGILTPLPTYQCCTRAAGG
jgi:hypothetical protein